ncbi:MAG: hypothetical protein RLZZ277_781 [Actinomycetota bacterium]|jgi:uncharacterized repeat protein (TIGR03847 family)
MIRIYKDLSRFTVGTIGLPGERTFFIQIRKGTEVLSASIEKSQVAAMSERIHYMLKEIRLAHPLTERPVLIRDSLPLDTPVMDEFRIGSIAIFYDENSELIQIDLRELNFNSEEVHDEETSDDVEILRIFITATQALIFSDRADLVVAAGRQPCPFCGLPIDPQGHLCARANGYRR